MGHGLSHAAPRLVYVQGRQYSKLRPRETGTKVTKDNNAVTLSLDLKTAENLADNLKEHTGAWQATNGMRALASVLQQAVYESKDHFRQPSHAFDDKAPKQPSIED